jgi:hypothetical protein
MAPFAGIILREELSRMKITVVKSPRLLVPLLKKLFGVGS